VYRDRLGDEAVEIHGIGKVARFECSLVGFILAGASFKQRGYEPAEKRQPTVLPAIPFLARLKF